MLKVGSKLFGLVSLIAILAACSQVAPLDAPLQKLVGASIVYVDKDAPVGGTGDTWDTAYTSLQDALDEARTTGGSEIWVAAGWYYPDEGATVVNDDASASFYLVEGVAIYGGFDGTDGAGGGLQETLLSDRDHKANLTILSGDIEQNDTFVAGFPTQINGINSDHVVYVDADGLGQTFTNATVLDGFIITSGSGSAGAGLYCDGDDLNGIRCSPYLANLWFHLNEASVGGAIAAYDSDLVVEGGLFTSNKALTGLGRGAAIYSYNSEMTVSANAAGAELVFTFNEAISGGAIASINSSNKITGANMTFNNATSHGGAIYLDNDDTEITDTLFLRNEAVALGGALYTLNSDFYLEGVEMFGNVAAAGGAISNSINAGNPGSADLINVAFSGNEAFGDGGAIYNENFGGGGFTLDLKNTSFSRNTSGGLGGSLYVDSIFTVDIANSILWGNQHSIGANEIHNAGGNVEIEFNTIKGGAAGISGPFTNNGNNSPAAPQFVNKSGPDGVFGTLDDDLSLQSISPALNAGSNALVPAGITEDLVDAARFVGTVDKGAYERQ